MKTCKDCIHYDVCEDNLKFIQERFLKGFTFRKSEFIDGEFCNLFKDKSRFIELPCSVGDTVYVLEYEDDCAVDYSGCIFIMANNDFAFLSPIINGERNPIEICNVFFDRYINFDNNSGIIVPLNELYLTKEEAEAKLKELSE